MNEELIRQVVSADAAPVSEETLRAYQSTARKLASRLRGKTLNEITETDIRAWCNWLVTEPIAVTTANFYRRTARAMFNRINRSDLAAALINRPEPPRENRAISDDDISRILAHANLRDAAIILLLAESGCRRGSIPRLLVDRLKIWQAQNGRFRLVAETIEKGRAGGEPRFIFAGHRTALAIQLWLDIRPHKSEYVFNSITTGEALEPNAITLMFRRLKMRAGIPKDHNVFAHAHRHRFAQKALDEHDAKVVSQWMGHKSVTTTLDIYGHRSVEGLAAAYFGDDDLQLPPKNGRSRGG